MPEAPLCRLASSSHVTRLFAVCTVALIVGCASKEEQCLDSVRLGLKVPDSVEVVANLGSRGVDKKDFFWLRYVTKTSHGAQVSTNMACTLSGEKWQRDTATEERIRFKAWNIALRQTADAMQSRHACQMEGKMSFSECEQRHPLPHGRLHPTDAERMTADAINGGSARATRIMFESVEPIPPELL